MHPSMRREKIDRDELPTRNSEEPVSLTLCILALQVRGGYKRHSSRYTVRKNQSRGLSRWDETTASTTIFPISFSVIFPVFRCSLRLCAFARYDLFSLARSLHSLKPQRSRRGTAQQHSWFVPHFASQTVSFAVSCVSAAWRDTHLLTLLFPRTPEREVDQSL